MNAAIEQIGSNNSRAICLQRERLTRILDIALSLRVNCSQDRYNEGLLYSRTVSLDSLTGPDQVEFPSLIKSGTRRSVSPSFRWWKLLMTNPIRILCEILLENCDIRKKSYGFLSRNYIYIEVKMYTRRYLIIKYQKKEKFLCAVYRFFQINYDLNFVIKVYFYTRVTQATNDTSFPLDYELPPLTP